MSGSHHDPVRSWLDNTPVDPPASPTSLPMSDPGVESRRFSLPSMRDPTEEVEFTINPPQGTEVADELQSDSVEPAGVALPVSVPSPPPPVLPRKRGRPPSAADSEELAEQSSQAKQAHFQGRVTRASSSKVRRTGPPKVLKTERK